MSASEVSSTGRPEDRSGDAVKIWNHIQAVMRGKRIICTARGVPLPMNCHIRRQQVVESLDLGIKRSQTPPVVDAPCSGLPQRYRLIE
jgi:hypothetical protein